jgi:hypothetical protein
VKNACRMDGWMDVCGLSSTLHSSTPLKVETLTFCHYTLHFTSLHSSPSPSPLLPPPCLQPLHAPHTQDLSANTILVVAPEGYRLATTDDRTSLHLAPAHLLPFTFHLTSHPSYNLNMHTPSTLPYLYVLISHVRAALPRTPSLLFSAQH